MTAMATLMMVSANPIPTPGKVVAVGLVGTCDAAS